MTATANKSFSIIVLCADGYRRLISFLVRLDLHDLLGRRVIFAREITA